jgi:hypothetical protein
MNRLLLGAMVTAVSLDSSQSLAQPAGHCPPGLARKNPPCVPPGQAKKWNLGDRYDGEWQPATGGVTICLVHGQVSGGFAEATRSSGSVTRRG